MFIINDDNSIYVNRGDILFFSVSAKEEDGTPHHFVPGDVLRIKVYGKKDAETVVLEKDFPVVENAEEVEIYLDKEDTKIGEVISKPKDYWYEVELNPMTAPQTIIGYGEEGACLFKLFPEGADVDEPYEPDPEDFPVVDEELSLTSPRPVANRIITAEIEKIRRDSAKDYVTPEMFGAVGDGVADDHDAINSALEYCVERGATLTLASDKVYGVSKPIVYDSEAMPFLLDGNNAKIKAIAGMDSVFKISTHRGKEGSLIERLFVDCNNLAKTGICLDVCVNFNIKDVRVFNFSDAGVRVVTGYEFYGDNLYFENAKDNTAVAVDMESTDSVLSNVVSKNVETTVKNERGGGCFYNVHGWNSILELVPHTVFMRIGAGCQLFYCVSDTCFKSFVLVQDGGFNFYHGCCVIYNTDYLNPNVCEAPIIFDPLEKENYKEVLMGCVFSNLTSYENGVYFVSRDDLASASYRIEQKTFAASNRFYGKFLNMPYFRDEEYITEFALDTSLWQPTVNIIERKGDTVTYSLKAKYLGSAASGFIAIPQAVQCITNGAGKSRYIPYNRSTGEWSSSLETGTVFASAGGFEFNSLTKDTWVYFNYTSKLSEVANIGILQK